MRLTCSSCRGPVVVDEMSDAERIACPSCGTEVHVRVGRVAEPPRPVPPPPRVMPLSSRPPSAPPPVGPSVAPIVRRAPPRPAIAPAPTVAAAPSVPRRSCPACDEKLAPGATTCDACGANYQRALRVKLGEPSTDDPGALPDAKSDANAGLVGGVAVMIISVVWFVVRYQANRFSLYAIFLFVFGVVGVFDGVARARRKSRKGRPRGRYR